jgi:hypothetical protein
VKPLFVRVERRVPVASALCVLLSFAAASVQPAWSLIFGLTVLGIPHVVSGVRHLAIRRELYPATRWLGWVGAALGVAAVAGAGRWVMPAFTVCFAACVLVEILGARSRPWHARILVAGAVILVAGVALRRQALFLLLVSYLHTVSSVCWYGVAARRRGIAVWPLVLGGAVGTLLIALGVTDGAHAWAALAPDEPSRWLGEWWAGGDPLVAQRAFTLFAFVQSLHYAVWIRLVPELDRPSPVPWSFRRALAALRDDLGRLTPVAIAACVLGGLALAAGGSPARDVYFVLVYFHIGLDAAGLARALAQRAPARAPAERS